MGLEIKDIDWDDLVKEIEAQEAFDDMCGNKVKAIYFGSVLSLSPSGKYYMPWASGNVTEKEAEKDEEWFEELEAEAEKRGLYVASGEGDPTDIVIGKLVDEEEEGKACLTLNKPEKK